MAAATSGWLRKASSSSTCARTLKWLASMMLTFCGALISFKTRRGDKVTQITHFNQRHARNTGPRGGEIAAHEWLYQ